MEEEYTIFIFKNLPYISKLYLTFRSNFSVKNICLVKLKAYISKGKIKDLKSVKFVCCIPCLISLFIVLLFWEILKHSLSGFFCAPSLIFWQDLQGLRGVVFPSKTLVLIDVTIWTIDLQYSPKKICDVLMM